MRTVSLLAMVLVFSATPLFAQELAQTNHLVAATNAVTDSLSTPRLFLLEPADYSANEHFVLQKKIRVSGPLVGPAKARSFSDFLRRVGHLFNPLAPESSGSVALSSAPTSGRAWSTLVGWSPGASAFPTEAHHEPPHLDLISFSVEKQP